jgi:pyruvyl transferase EpsI
MQRYFTDIKVGICPDMVLYLNETEPQFIRSGILCCLRHDAEMKLNREQSDGIINLIKQTYVNENVRVTDTVNVTKTECLPQTYEATLRSFWNMLKGSRVVVTDRLHCMIFCVITKTPCVVLDNTNNKISGVYDAWLKPLNYIVMLREFNMQEIMMSIDKLYNIDLKACPDIELKRKFDPLVNSIKQ